MTDATATTDLVAETYRAAANDLESRNHDNAPFVAGPETWSAAHAAVRDLITSPLIEGVRRRVGVDQVQFWSADKDTVIKTLRDLAGDHEQLDLLREANAEHRIAVATRILREAFGWPAADYSALETIAQDATRQLKVLRSENKRLREALAAAQTIREEPT